MSRSTYVCTSLKMGRFTGVCDREKEEIFEFFSFIQNQVKAKIVILSINSGTQIELGEIYWFKIFNKF